MMETKRLFTGVIVIIIVTIGVFGFLVTSMSFPNDNNNDTTTDDTDDSIYPPLIFDDQDLLNESIEVPNWNFTLSTNETLSMADLRGRITILDFMARWCGYCAQQNHHLRILQEEYGDSINIVSVCVDLADTLEQLTEYKEEKNVTWPLGLDIDGSSDWLRVRYIPTLVIVDGDGMLRWNHEGTWDATSMAETIESLMG
ncbi:MAG: redoxin domain-containing protein [Candidatus Lokiarchaeota archaeon]|nr:redoxin domain-containing protein [Candidatus Lokiarchaeota archaeon]